MTFKARNVTPLARHALTAATTVAIAYTLLAQLLTIVPVSWTTPLLQWDVSQFLIILLGTLRDALGIWNIVVGLLGVVGAATLWRAPVAQRRRDQPARARRPRHRLPLALLLTGSAGTLSAITATTVLAISIAPLGTGTSPLLPTLPFTGLSSSPSQTVTVGRAGNTTLRADLYLPRGTAPVTGWPVVVSIHGGGFSTGTRGPNAYTGFLPQHGYAVLDVDYRLASSHHHPWRTQVTDIGCSLAWIGKAGPTERLDPRRIATLGLSSGGNLAVNAAYMSANQTLTSSCDSSDASIPTVRAVIAGYPAVDLSGIGNRSAIGRLVEQWYVGGTPAQYPDRYRFTDSATHVSAHSPPTLIYQGGRDHLVFADRARRFAHVLAEHHILHQFVEYPGLEHGAGDANGTLTTAAAASRQLTLDWLRHHDA
ncbi:alpha/beta hydrolase fold domain-containing protein [Curtobacterium sp. Curtsp57]|uniref:alpha/beta hydrolase fold domain-containing protein n=1 Tax=Curtobacterium sp. Curtsp57 TaxID=3243047 RepID=UPI0039B4D67C